MEATVSWAMRDDKIVLTYQIRATTTEPDGDVGDPVLERGAPVDRVLPLGTSFLSSGLSVPVAV